MLRTHKLMEVMGATEERVSFETLFHAYEPVHSEIHYSITLITLALLSCSLGNNPYFLFFQPHLDSSLRSRLLKGVLSEPHDSTGGSP